MSEIIFQLKRDILCLPCYMCVLFFVINMNEIPKHFTFINGFLFAEKHDLLCNHSNDDHSSC